MTRDERGAPLVRIRVKERIGSTDRPPGRTAGRPEKIVLVIVGACLGLGIGYLLAGKLASFLRPPIAVVKAVDREGPPGGGKGATQAAPAMEFELPAQGE